MMKYTKCKWILSIILGIIVGTLSLQIGSMKALPNITGQAGSSVASNEFYEQWGLFSENGIQLEDAWKITEGNHDIRVGVIDTGISEHEALNVDTSLGWSVYFDDADNIVDTKDVNGHGTHVAGIIGANGIDGVYGVAPNVTLVPLRVSHKGEGWSTSIIADTINYATSLYKSENRIDILNFSGWNLGNDGKLEKAIKNFPGLFVTIAGSLRQWLAHADGSCLCYVLCVWGSLHL